MSGRGPFDDDAPPPPSMEDRIEVPDSGETLEDALADAERSAIQAAEDKLSEVQRDLALLKDRHLRKLAEFENLRKRSEREKSEYYRQALASFLGDFLEVADNFQRALDHARAEELESDFGQGVELIHKQFAELWKRYGLKEVDTSHGFDPNLHEAVATEESDAVAPQTILKVLQKGYMLQDRLVRPALVKVAVRESEVPAEKGEAG
ncbi:MAG: nucleotide exchange factor GrpE [Thermoanaerobaculia bacterium]